MTAWVDVKKKKRKAKLRWSIYYSKLIIDSALANNKSKIILLLILLVYVNKH